MTQLTSLENTLSDLFLTLKESSAKVDTTAAIGISLHRVTAGLNEMMSGFRFQRETEHIARDDSDKRRHPRLKRGILVRVAQGGDELESLVSDLSMSGTVAPGCIFFGRISGVPSRNRMRLSSASACSVSSSISWLIRS